MTLYICEFAKVPTITLHWRHTVCQGVSPPVHCGKTTSKHLVKLRFVSVFKVVIGPNVSLPEGTVVSMHHPEEEEEEDDDEFLSDDAEVGRIKDKTKLKGVY